MKTPDDYSISMAYSYKNSKELARYYDDSAKDYDDFVNSVGYVLPRLVAEKAAQYLRDSDTVIDIGCGTGLLGIELNSIKDGLCIHGVDVSSWMVLLAYEKKKANGERHYGKLYHADIGGQNNIMKDHYSFMVSSGTFTTGHLDGKHLSGVVGLMKKDSFAVFSVKSDHFEQSHFIDDIKELENNKLIDLIEISEVDSYENSGYTALSRIVSIRTK